MKKTICVGLAIIFILSLCACNNKVENAPTNTPSTATPANTFPTDTPFVSIDPTDDPDYSAPTSAPTPGSTASFVFDTSLFPGKLRSCSYAGDGQLLVLTDKLYLYDTRSATVRATASAPMDDFYVQIFHGGFLLAGFGDNGPTAYIYGNDLSLQKEISHTDILPGDFVVSETGFAISSDGKKLAIAAMRGLYLYDLNSEKLDTLLDYTAGVGTTSIQLSMLNSLVFAQDNANIYFCGDGVPTSGGDSFSLYGSVAVDGSNLKLTKPASYEIEELLCGGGRLFLPKEFSKSNGTLLWMDSAGHENTLAFSTTGEGKNGVYCSEQGRYVATAVLDGSLTVRIYDVDNGSLVRTEEIENANSIYFNRIPRIYIWDDAHTAVVLLGGSISEAETLVSIIDFGG